MATPTQHRRRDGEKKLQVLLAEDNPVNRLLLVRLLERRGHRVVAVANGRDALATLEHGSFDLVLMDVQMPEMDGLQATAAIRARERGSGAHLPIVAVTTHTSNEDRDRCLRAGMDAFHGKPIEAAQLMATIERVVAQAP
jgi:CheY-like chemotaxis protein